jgi:hypothetical protein
LSSTTTATAGVTIEQQLQATAMTALHQGYVLTTLWFQSSSTSTPRAYVGLDNTADENWTNPLLHECGWRHVGSDDDGVTVTSLILVQQMVGGRIPTDLVL